jgi:hypothetical protein
MNLAHELSNMPLLGRVYAYMAVESGEMTPPFIRAVSEMMEDETNVHEAVVHILLRMPRRVAQCMRKFRDYMDLEHEIKYTDKMIDEVIGEYEDIKPHDGPITKADIAAAAVYVTYECTGSAAFVLFEEFVDERRAIGLTRFISMYSK